MSVLNKGLLSFRNCDLNVAESRVFPFSARHRVKAWKECYKHGCESVCFAFVVHNVSGKLEPFLSAFWHKFNVSE